MEGRSQAGFSARFPGMKQWSGWKANVGSARVFSTALLLMALAGMGMVLAATHWGAGLSDDSYFYIKPARDILAGRTPFFSPHYPPLLPLIVTLLGFLRLEPLQGIRLFNAACFGLNIFLGGWIIYRLTDSRGAGIAVIAMGVYFALGQDVKGISMNPAQLRDNLRQTGGYLVVFDSMPLNLYGYPAKEFLQGLTAIEKYSDCVVYQAQP